MNIHLIITVLITVLLFKTVIFSFPNGSITDTGKIVTGNNNSVENGININKNIKKVSDDSLMDTSSVDTVEKEKRRNFLLNNNNYAISRYQFFPDIVDSIYNPYIFSSYKIYQTDDVSMSDILYWHPLYVSIPVSISSTMNRFLYFGFPSHQPYIYSDNSVFSVNTGSYSGQNIFSSAEIHSLRFYTPGVIRIDCNPKNLTRPETLIMVELGLFNENTVNLRFMRPVTKNLQFGLFSDFEFFQRKRYSHSTGGMYGFYKSIYNGLGIDTTYISNYGFNPGTKQQTVAAALKWNPVKKSEVSLTYLYSDLHNDIVFDSIGLQTRGMQWLNMADYCHNINLQAGTGLLPYNFMFNSEVFMKKEVNLLMPITSTYVSSGSSRHRGTDLLYGCALQSSFFAGRNLIQDTVSVQYSTNRDEKEDYGNNRYIIHRNDIKLANSVSFSIGSLQENIKCTGGYSFIKLNDSLESFPVWKITSESKKARQSLNMYIIQDILPPFIPFYDSLFRVIPGSMVDCYQYTGAEIGLYYRKAGIIIGTCFMNNIQEISVRKLWLNGISPYKQPAWSFILSPSFGKWKGFSLLSQLVFSDKKPYIKSKSILSYHANRDGRPQHIILDIGLDYWSERDSLHTGSFGGVSIWHRPIYDLHLKTTVQIKTFRLFYKIDNILNRRIAYLPGYYMPGLVFRWGFNWQFQG